MASLAFPSKTGVSQTLLIQFRSRNTDFNLCGVWLYDKYVIAIKTSIFLHTFAFSLSNWFILQEACFQYVLYIYIYISNVSNISNILTRFDRLIFSDWTDGRNINRTLPKTSQAFFVPQLETHPKWRKIRNGANVRWHLTSAYAGVVSMRNT